MTDITRTAEVQTVSKPEVDRDKRIEQVRDAVLALDLAIYDLSGELATLDDGDVPESVRDLAASMRKDAEEVRREFDRYDFLGQVEELGEELAAKEGENDEDELQGQLFEEERTK